MAGLSSGTGNKRAPLKERKDDLYETPAAAVHALLGVEELSGFIWEPACGPGAIVRVLRAANKLVYATDLVNYQSPDQNAWGRDFLMERRVPICANQPATTIITNPPFKLCGEFVAHALTLCPRVIMLMRLAFLESEKRRDVIDNSPLARVHIFRKRLPMMHRAGWEGRKSNSGMAFAWFVWEQGHQGPATLHRVSWEEFAPLEAAA